MADAIGITPNSLYNKMRGDTQFTLEEMQIVAKRYHLNAQDIYDIFFLEDDNNVQ